MIKEIDNMAIFQTFNLNRTFDHGCTRPRLKTDDREGMWEARRRQPREADHH